MDITMRPDGLELPAVQALLREHLEDMALHSPPEAIHAIDLHGLRGPGLSFWAAWEGDVLLGCCALRELDAAHGELKSMRTTRSQRRRGVGAVMLRHLLDEAARRSYTRLSLETGSAEAFEPARALYARFGFAFCGPFAEFVDSPHSMFMTRELADTDTGSDTGSGSGAAAGAGARAALSPLEIARSLTELWSPRVIAAVDDNYIKVAKVHGSLAWHRHDNEDELFLVLEGRLRLEFDDGTVELSAGQMHVVPKGVRHNPVAEHECLLLLMERKSTLHTGDVVTDKSRAIDEQLRPFGQEGAGAGRAQ